MKYIVTIREMLEKRVIVEAESAYEAKQIAKDHYDSYDIRLTSDDYDSVDFSIGRPITPDLEEGVRYEIANNAIDDKIYR